MRRRSGHRAGSSGSTNDGGERHLGDVHVLDSATEQVSRRVAVPPHHAAETGLDRLCSITNVVPGDPHPRVIRFALLHDRLHPCPQQVIGRGRGLVGRNPLDSLHARGDQPVVGCAVAHLPEFVASPTRRRSILVQGAGVSAQRRRSQTDAHGHCIGNACKPHRLGPGSRAVTDLAHGVVLPPSTRRHCHQTIMSTSGGIQRCGTLDVYRSGMKSASRHPPTSSGGLGVAVPVPCPLVGRW